MLRLLPLLAVAALFTGCSAQRYDPLLPLDIVASYEQQPTLATTVPRAHGRHGFVGKPISQADLEAVRQLGMHVEVGDFDTSNFFAATGTIRLKSSHTRAVLIHECTHGGQISAGIYGHEAQEAGAMIAEVALLISEGWTDERIRALSRNNSQSPDWLFAWIRAFGPKFTGGPADVQIAFFWGRDQGRQVAQLVGAAP